MDYLKSELGNTKMQEEKNNKYSAEYIRKYLTDTI